MSNALAIAAVTAVLKDLLTNGLIDRELDAATGTVNITAKPPDLITTGPSEAPQLNLFMYRVSENQGWRNAGLPSCGADGQRLSNPPLPLNLHYLLMAYGGSEFQAEILLGYAMQLLHETPVLDRAAIRTALTSGPVSGGELPTAYQALSASDLADQVELIKLSPESLSVEDLSKLWTAFAAKYYRPAAAYQASVVLIQGARSTRSSLPVRKPKIYALPFKQPTIDRVFSDVAGDEDPRLTIESILVVTGTALKGPKTLVRLGHEEVSPEKVTDTRISFPLAPLTSLRAGVQGVQVVQKIPMGEPERDHHCVESNVAAFVLHPMITATASVTANKVIDNVTYCKGTIRVDFKPNVGKAQRVSLLLNEFDAPGKSPSRAYSFPAPRDNGVTDPHKTDAHSIVFSISGVKAEDFPVQAGDYLVRVQVDGAESLLVPNVEGKYDSPQVAMKAP